MSSFKAKLLNGLVWRFAYYVSAFILNVLISHYLGAAKSGVFYLLINNLAFIVLLLSVGIDSAIGYFNARKEISNKKVLSLSIIWSGIATVIVLIVYAVAVHLNLIPSQILGFYLLVYIIGSLLTTFLSALVFSTGDNRTPSIVLTITNIILLFFIPLNPIISNLITDEGYTKVYLIVAALPALLFIIFLLLKKNDNTINKSKEILPGTFLKFALQSFLFSLLYTLLLRCDYWVVNYFCSDADLGNYMQTAKLNQLILLVPTLVSFTLFPLIVSQVHQQKMIESKVLKLVSIYFFIGLAICICIITAGYWILPLLYGESFSKMYFIFILLSPGILFLAAAYPLNTFFASKNLVRVNIMAIFISIIILLAIDFLLIQHYGIYGAAIGSTAGYSFYFIYLLYKFRKNHSFKIFTLFNLSKLIKENRSEFFNIKMMNED